MANKCAVGLAICIFVLILSAGCSLLPSAGQADLAPILTFKDQPGRPVAFEAGQPVPTFDPTSVDTSLSLTNRKSSLPAITRAQGDRALAEYDYSSWSSIQVPGRFNLPPNRSTTSGYYRRAGSTRAHEA